MDSEPIRLRHFLLPAGLMALPVGAVMVLCVALGAISPGDALLAALAMIAGIAFVTGLLLTDLEAVRRYVIALGRDADTPRPHLVFRDMLYQLMAAFIRTVKAPSAPSADRAVAVSALDKLPDPVLMLDSARRVVRTNAPAQALLGLNLVGRDLAAMIRNPALLQAVDVVLRGDDQAMDVEFTFHVPVERHFSARIVRLDEPDDRGIVVVIALNDITTLRRSEEMRSDFIANASHELRTPISVILGCVQTLRGPARDDIDAQAEFFGLMEGQAERMARLVDDLLALSRIELDEHTTPTGEIDLDNLLGQVRDTLSINAAARGMDVVIDISPDLAPLKGDAEDLTKVFQNLIDNAIKYSADNTTVTVQAKPAGPDLPPPLTDPGRYIAVSVADRGEGIAPEHLPRLTERFYRVDTAQSRRLGGTGLGLAIVKHAINRHRAALTIESTEGEGSVFTVYLPATRAATPDYPEKKGSDGPVPAADLPPGQADGGQ